MFAATGTPPFPTNPQAITPVPSRGSHRPKIRILREVEPQRTPLVPRAFRTVLEIPSHHQCRELPSTGLGDIRGLRSAFFDISSRIAPRTQSWGRFVSLNIGALLLTRPFYLECFGRTITQSHGFSPEHEEVRCKTALLLANHQWR